jgi:hypothetical protein
LLGDELGTPEARFSRAPKHFKHDEEWLISRFEAAPRHLECGVQRREHLGVEAVARAGRLLEASMRQRDFHDDGSCDELVLCGRALDFRVGSPRAALVLAEDR